MLRICVGRVLAAPASFLGCVLERVGLDAVVSDQAGYLYGPWVANVEQSNMVPTSSFERCH
jgi:hypothetical protein